jgi:predicted DNA-binding transcriptional regulator AlpA
MEPEREENQLLTADQVADRLQVDRQWVYRHQRHLGPIRLSRKRLRFRSQAVERYIDSRGKVASRR